MDIKDVIKVLKKMMTTSNAKPNQETNNDAINSAIDMLSKSQWHEVNKELPKYNKEIIFCDSMDNMYIGWLAKNLKSEPLWRAYGENDEVLHITYWREKPVTPNQEKERSKKWKK